mmetsp:Transcript_6790/g.12355  ORF Transcript_6790/g.12355 Transcript_6790/m.12355 type:complete len:81 (+) Transcript_6790:83-325(+)
MSTETQKKKPVETLAASTGTERTQPDAQDDDALKVVLNQFFSDFHHHLLDPVLHRLVALAIRDDTRATGGDKDVCGVHNH